jgi:putative transcriptional regulator
MQEARSRKGCSIGYVSGKIGISRRSISLYESGTSTTIDVFSKLKAFLGEDISRSINLRETMRESKFDTDEESFYENEFLKGIKEIMGGFGMITEFFKKLPFDALSEEQSELVYIMGISERDQFEARKINYIRNICTMLEKEPVLISTTDTTKDTMGGCSLITFKELLEMGSLENFQRRIEKIKESTH